MDLTTRLYHYRGHITAVYDGDTVTVDMDLGLKTWVRGEKLRLYGINAPEMRGAEREAGKASRDYMRALVLDRDVIVETLSDKKGKYGRYLANLWVQNADGEWQNANDLLVQAGHAVYRDY